MKMSKDYYKILGVDKSASEEDIKKAFRRLAHQHHPDKANGNVDKFKEINEAYQILSNREKRTQYDRFGSDFQNGGPNTGGFGGFNSQGFNVNMDDLGDLFGGFGDIFGFSNQRGASQRQRGRDLEMILTMEFQEAVFGAEKNLRLAKAVTCERCHGSGHEPGAKVEICSACRGSGQVVGNQRTIFGQMQVRSVCPDCQGSGRRVSQDCSACRGQGLVNDNVEIKVKIPAGIDEDETIRLAGQGDAGQKGGQPGDLYLKIKIKEHKQFQRRGYNLSSQLDLTFSEAVLGVKRDIATIDGEVVLKIPAGTQSGQIFVLKDKGVPHLRGRGRGDLLIQVNVRVPKNLNKQQKKLVEELGETGM